MSTEQIARGTLTWRGFFLRWLLAAVVVSGTWNPTGWSWGHWALSGNSVEAPYIILVGLVLLGCYALFFRATSRSLGKWGVLLFIAIAATLFWILMVRGLMENLTLLSWLVLFAITVLMTLGMTGSFLWRRLTGQYDVSSGADDVEPEV